MWILGVWPPWEPVICEPGPLQCLSIVDLGAQKPAFSNAGLCTMLAFRLELIKMLFALLNCFVDLFDMVCLQS